MARRKRDLYLICKCKKPSTTKFHVGSDCVCADHIIAPYTAAYKKVGKDRKYVFVKIE